jgi:hypothetical protein
MADSKLYWHAVQMIENATFFLRMTDECRKEQCLQIIEERRHTTLWNLWEKVKRRLHTMPPDDFFNPIEASVSINTNDVSHFSDINIVDMEDRRLIMGFKREDPVDITFKITTEIVSLNQDQSHTMTVTMKRTGVCE